MQPTFFLNPIVVLLLMLLIGFVAGVGITVFLYRNRRPASSDVAGPSASQRDSNNPYEPSTVGLRATNGTTGCAIAFAVFLIAAITVIAFAAALFFAATSVVRSVPAPMPPPPTVVQPQQAQPQQAQPQSE